MVKNCSECRHSKVCKYINDFKIFSKKVEELRKTLKGDAISIFSLDVSCQFFSIENTPILKDVLLQDRQLLNEGLKTIDITTNPCSTCPNKPDPDKLVVGDSACQWCEHNPLKVTCH